MKDHYNMTTITGYTIYICINSSLADFIYCVVVYLVHVQHVVYNSEPQTKGPQAAVTAAANIDYMYANAATGV